MTSPPRLLLVVAVLCLVPIQGAAADPAATGGTCRSTVPAGCVEAEVIPTGGHRVTPATRVLQFNLCDSGQADCYTHGRSPGEAAGVIDRYRPDLVTLNEICSRDVLLATAPITAEMTRLARADGDAAAFALFTPAIDEVTGAPYHCVNGDLYGIGIVGRGATPGPPTRYEYRSQYTRTDEGRVALCATAGDLDVCTTHLESDSATVANRECGELLGRGGYADRFLGGADRPVLVGGDLNLGAQVSSCAPGWGDRGDRGVQHVLWHGAVRLTGTRIVPMHFTDHPALLVDLAPVG